MSRANQFPITYLGILGLIGLGSLAACRFPEGAIDQGLGDLRRPRIFQVDENRIPGLSVALAPDIDLVIPEEFDDMTIFKNRNASLRDILLTLFDGSDLSLVIDSDIRGEVTFDFKKTTFSQAFLSLLEHNGLGFRHEGSFVRVSQEETRIFDLNYLSGTGTSTVENAGLSSSGGEFGESNIGQTAGGDQETSETGESRSGIWSTITQDLATIAGEATKLVVNATTGTIVVTAKTDILRDIEEYLERTQDAISRQVMIEARLVEINLSDNLSMNVDYSILPDQIATDELGLLPDSLYDGVLGLTTPSNHMFQQSTGASTSGIGLRYGVVKQDKYRLLVSMLQTMGQVRILSAPRVATLNNVPATIQLVEQVPVIKTEVVTSATSSQTTQNVTFEQAGITIQVTPQISQTGEIFAEIKPSITEVNQTIVTADGGQTPVMATRATNSILRVRDGETIILGGVRSVRKSETISGIPVLMEIPLIGALFRSNTQSRSENELLVMMTPTVMRPEDMQEMVHKGLARIERISMPFHLSTFNINNAEDQPFKAPPGNRATAVFNPTEEKETVEIEQAISRKGLARLFLKKGIEKYSEGRYYEAQSQLLRSRLFHHLNGEVDTYLALIAMARGDRVLARKHLDKRLVENPQDPFALNNRGILELIDGHPLIGEPYLRKAAALWPENPDIHNNLGLAYSQLGYRELARTEFDKALDIRESHGEAHFNMARLYDDADGYPEDSVPHYESFLNALPARAKDQGEFAARRLRWLRDGVKDL